MKSNLTTPTIRNKPFLIRTLAASIFLLSLPLAASATQYRTVEHPRQECWNEQVAQQSPGNYGGAIVGGLTGGLLGNQIGRGNGRIAATAVGAATGAVVGDRLSGAPGYTTVQRCRTVVDREQVIINPERTYYQYDNEHEYEHHRKHRHHKHEDDDDD